MKKIIYGFILMVSLLVVSTSVYAFSGILYGEVTVRRDAGCGGWEEVPLANVLVRTDLGGVGLTDINGNYALLSGAGNGTATFDASGYGFERRSFTVREGGQTQIDVCFY
jgi:hypothetical protein